MIFFLFFFAEDGMLAMSSRYQARAQDRDAVTNGTAGREPLGSMQDGTLCDVAS